jgi:ribosomal protein S2
MASDSESSAGPCVPKGVLKSRGGWQGDELELERSAAEPDKAVFAAVDLDQFRNTQVGKGYQAKHVVRQRTREQNKMEIINAALPTTLTKSKTQEQKDYMDLERHSSENPANRRKKDDNKYAKEKLSMYLKSEGLRTFRLQLGEIELEASK